MSSNGRIDFHAHFVPDVYRHALANAGLKDIGSVPFPEWSLDRHLEMMETLGVRRALLSISAPGVDCGRGPETIALARATNDLLGEMKAQHPDKIGGLIALPLPDVDAALAELRRLENTGLEGLILLTNYRGTYLTDAKFAPLMEELNRRKVMVLLHPGLPAGVNDLHLALPPPILEFVFDTTRCVADMIFTGWRDRYPDIRFILSHLGGALPFVAWRMSMIEHSPRGAFSAFRERGKSVESYLKTFYYDTAVSASPRNLRLLIDLVGTSRLVFGSDIPFLAFAFAQHTAAAMDGADFLSEADHNAINYRNGTTLLAPGGI